MDVIQAIQPFHGPKPPKGAPIGHIWYNTDKSLFYVKDTEIRWVAVDDTEFVIDVILEEDNYEDAYDRAMSIL